jgi:general secretion pathway protein I
MRQRQGGFTLLEALVAFVMLSLALSALLQGGAAGLRNAGVAGRTEEAVARARSHLSAFDASGHPAAEDLQGDEGNGYHWRLKATPVTSVAATSQKGQAARQTTLYDVTATISWAAGAHGSSVQLTTQRLTPVPPGSP